MTSLKKNKSIQIMLIFIQILMSQITKYDLFTDVIFSTTVYGCGFTTIGIISATIVLLNISFIFINYLSAITM